MRDADRGQPATLRGLEAFLSLSPDAVIVVGPDGRIREANDVAAELFGWTTGELVGVMVDELVPQAVRHRHADLRSGYTRSPRRRPMGALQRLAACRRDGTVFPVQVSLAPAVVDDEAVVIAVVRDVTELQRLSAEAERWADVFEHAEVGMVMGRPGVAELELMNPAFARMHGYEIDELRGRPVLSVFAPEERDWARSHIATAEREGHHTFESVHVRRDGSRFPVLVDVTAVRDHEGRLLYRAAIVTDISKRRAAEEELQRSRQAHARSEALYRAIVEHLPDTVVTLVDRDLRVLAVEGEAMRSSGYSRLALIGRRLPDAFPPGPARDRMLFSFREALAGRRAQAEMPPTTPGRRYVLDVAPVKDGAGVVTGAVGLAFDVTERRRQEEQYRRVFEDGPIGIATLGPDLRLESVNPALRIMLGLPAEQLVGRRLTELPVEGDHGRLVDAERQLLAGHSDALEVDQRYSTPGRSVHARLTLARAGPHADAFVAIVQDITAEVEAEQRLTHLATHDDVTGLANRSVLLDRIAHALTRAAEHHQHIAVLLCDLDHFNRINDSLGHAAGDDLLRVVAARLSDCLGPTDSLARLGGDEFVILTEDLPANVDAARFLAERLADRLGHAVYGPASVDGRAVHTTLSIGVAVGGETSQSAEALLRDADTAMYHAKSNGRGRFAVFDRHMLLAAQARQELEADLHGALARGEFTVYYQPIVDLANGLVVGGEALLRWQHPTRGLVLPDDFLDAADDTGLIVPIGAFVLDQATRAVASWRRATDRPVFVAVNVAARQLARPQFPAEVGAAVLKAGLDPDAVHLEITENTLLDATGAAAGQLDALAAVFSVGMDDFGTGYGALSHLSRLPLRFVKVDRSFVGGLSRDPGARSIVEAIIRLATSMGLDVVAEGIEDPAQAATVVGIGPCLGQGWLFGHPMPAEEFALRLTSAQSILHRRDDHDRAGGVMEDLLADGAEKEPGEPSPSPGPYDKQLGVLRRAK